MDVFLIILGFILLMFLINVKVWKMKWKGAIIAIVVILVLKFVLRAIFR